MTHAEETAAGRAIATAVLEITDDCDHAARRESVGPYDGVAAVLVFENVQHELGLAGFVIVRKP